VEILSGDSTTLSASTIGEDATFIWYDSNGDTLVENRTITVSPSSTTTYKVEVRADADFYKDYDEVTVTVKPGLITNIAPNPSSGSTVISYEIPGVSTATIELIEVSTGSKDTYSITPGTGTLNVDVSAFNTGAYTVLLLGDSNPADDDLLIVQ
jgi:hypothetical protein